MRRLHPAAACGGDDGDSNGDGGAAQADGSPTATPTPKLLPTPPKANDDEVILSASGTNSVHAHAEGVPRASQDEGGCEGPEGRRLPNEIAAKVSAPAESYVTVQGFRADGRMIQFVRLPLKDIGAESILIADENGRLNLVSSKLAESEWLVNVTVISFP